MWVLLALGSAVFAGITSVLAKCGIKNTDSTAATAIRTAVVLLMSFVMVLIAGSLGQIADISAKSWIFLVLSGLATGASWLCYFRALQLGDVNKVVPVDKSSTVLTLLFAFIVLGEPISWLKGICVVLIGAGTYLMTEKKKDKGDEGGQKKEKKGAWLLYAVLSAVFAALTSILAKIGIDQVESNLATMIRTAVVLVMSFVCVFATGKGGALRGIPRRACCLYASPGLRRGQAGCAIIKRCATALQALWCPLTS